MDLSRLMMRRRRSRVGVGVVKRVVEELRGGEIESEV
jgi:hypothetical protein